MLININNIEIDVRFSVTHFCDVVDYKKRYENERVSVGKYLVQLQSEEGFIDSVLDGIFYSHAIPERQAGRQPKLTYADVAVWVMQNPEKMQEVAALFTESMPATTEGKEDKGQKKK
jgi:hypothetical protein